MSDEQEREHSRGPLSKDTWYRLIVIGPIGVREIDRLIQRLEIDRDILKEGAAALSGKEET
jgi:hypothetical protein